MIQPNGYELFSLCAESLNLIVNICRTWLHPCMFSFLWLCQMNVSICFLQWDDETDMAKLEECVRSVQMDGLLWGASKLVPVGYGIKKLQINCVVEDDKVGTDILEEEITKFEDFVSNNHFHSSNYQKAVLMSFKGRFTQMVPTFF